MPRGEPTESENALLDLLTAQSMTSQTILDLLIDAGAIDGNAAFRLFEDRILEVEIGNTASHARVATALRPILEHLNIRGFPN